MLRKLTAIRNRKYSVLAENWLPQQPICWNMLHTSLWLRLLRSIGKLMSQMKAFKTKEILQHFTWRKHFMGKNKQNLTDIFYSITDYKYHHSIREILKSHIPSLTPQPCKSKYKWFCNLSTNIYLLLVQQSYENIQVTAVPFQSAGWIACPSLPKQILHAPPCNHTQWSFHNALLHRKLEAWFL